MQCHLYRAAVVSTLRVDVRPTAPLVETRYFIIPWVMWRLNVPALPLALDTEEHNAEDGSGNQAENPSKSC
jgi:hypothetical protein